LSNLFFVTTRGLMSSTVEQPESDRVWSVELNGINPIEQQERHGHPIELFWIWFAGNIGILGVVYGAQYLAGNGLNLWQSLIIGLVATAVSFIFVGILSIPGVWGGAPMLTLSRAIFGTRGNLGPTLISWISLVGWETILVITSTYALLALFRVVGIQTSPVWTLISIIILAAAVVACGYWGHATLVWLQRLATWVFSILTIIIIAFLIPQTDWHRLLSQPPGPWDTGVVTSFIIVMGNGHWLDQLGRGLCPLPAPQEFGNGHHVLDNLWRYAAALCADDCRRPAGFPSYRCLESISRPSGNHSAGAALVAGNSLLADRYRRTAGGCRS